MTTNQLSQKIRLEFAGAGHYNAFVTRYKKVTKILITDMDIVDAIKSKEKNHWCTEKQALQSIWNKAKIN